MFCIELNILNYKRKVVFFLFLILPLRVNVCGRVCLCVPLPMSVCPEWNRQITQCVCWFKCFKFGEVESSLVNQHQRRIRHFFEL